MSGMIAQLLPGTARERPAFAAMVLAGLALMVILSALGFEHIGGFKPCELCYVERDTWYAALPLSLVALWAARSEKNSLAMLVLLALALLFLWNTGLSFFHAGMEWKWWTGPSSCTSGGGDLPSFGSGDLLSQLENITVVPCDEAQFRLFGLSFAGYDAILSLFCTALALWGMMAARGRNAS